MSSSFYVMKKCFAAVADVQTTAKTVVQRSVIRGYFPVFLYSLTLFIAYRAIGYLNGEKAVKRLSYCLLLHLES